jgi:hypothetical protein
MKITKELKHITFEYDEEKKSFAISGEHPPLRDTCNTIELNKVYAFAFMRFVIRMSQRNWLRQIKKDKKGLDKRGKDMLSLEDIDNTSSDENQMLIFEEEEIKK